MKRLTCEMCGGTDIVKKDGLFECQVCGCKYSLEEARKMLVEGAVEIKGTVEVQGTVQVDNASYVQKYLQNARRAKSKEDWEETEKYYNLVEQNDPTNIEAIFYSAYGKAKQALIPTDYYPREAAFRVLNNSVSVIDDNYDPAKAKEEEKAIRSMSEDVLRMITGEFVYNYRTDGYGNMTWSDKAQTYQLFYNFQETFVESIQNIIKKDEQPYLYEVLIQQAEGVQELEWIAQKSKWNYLEIKESAEEALERLRIEDYWNNHPEQKAALLEKKKNVETTISSLEQKREANPYILEIRKAEKEKETLEEEMASLSLFARKERRPRRLRIEELEEHLVELWRHAKVEIKEIEDEISIYADELEQIENEWRQSSPKKVHYKARTTESAAVAFRDSPDGKLIGWLSGGTEVTILEWNKPSQWAHVRVDGTSGYVEKFALIKN